MLSLNPKPLSSGPHQVLNASIAGVMAGCSSCEKPKVNYRKGLWSPEEDQRLREYVMRHGHGCWSSVPIKAGLQRNGKSCRLRWINYLRPGLKRGFFSQEEEAVVMKLHAALGNKWSQIAMHLPGRTDNEVKNHWNSYLKKKTVKLEEGSNPHATSSRSLIDSANQVPGTMQFCQELSASNSLEPLESSLAGSSQSISLGVDQASSFPRVIFADWLPTDHASSAMSCQWGSSYSYNEEVFDGKSSGEFQHGSGGNGTYGEFQSQYGTGSQLQGGDLFDLLSMGEYCGSLDIDHDVMY